ncbi:MAG: SLBB domain-containing protein [Candidatus Rokubacteria bacterium]|nr:SLBB domain-containing protein [Candidatus Rokubacteria bacterium]
MRKTLSVTLVVSLLAPNLGLAQPAAPGPPAAPPLAGRTVTQPAPAPLTGRTIPGPDYRLGPGDLLDVQIAGRLEVIRSQVVVDLEGAVSVPPIGSIPLAGLTLLQAHRRVVERARAVFRFVDVTVAVIAPRAFEVTVSGEVERPGTLIVTATRRVHDVILEAGGITPRGSVRRVVVTRQGVPSEFDLLSFELRGDLAQNPFVEEGLRIVVPPKGPSVTLAGAVRRPGEYEIGPSPSLAALLDLVGGPVQAATGGDARLTRVGPDGRKETLPLDLRTALRRPADVTLQPGDTLFVPPLSALQDVVEVRGAFLGGPESSKTTIAGKATIVQRFELAQGDRVRDIVFRAGGAAAYAELRLAVIERGGVSGPRQRIPVDLQRLLVEKDETQNVLLQNGDVVALPVVEDKVYIVGEVKAPGGVDFRPELTPREYVILAGGPTNRAKLRNTSVTFRSGQTYAMADAPPLEPGAVVTVPEVAVKWWQDYLTIAQAIASLVTAYTGVYLIFGGPIEVTR